MGRTYQYSDEELRLLHEELYAITAEVKRVCHELGIGYFIIGGTAIGAYYWQRILPWDDDIDIGMTRPDYERFLREAPAVLGKQYFLQTPQSEAHSPFWFAKLRKHNTLFLEHHFRKLPIHHGIFVDIFPFDNLTSRPFLERIQHSLFGFLNACFIGKEVWQWRHCGRCEVDEPLERGFVGCLLTRLVNTLLPKCAVFGLLKWVQTWFNSRPTPYLKNIVTANERVRRADVATTQEVTLGPLMVSAPQHLLDYLHNHYPTLRKDIPKEEQVNHRPDELQFDMSAAE